MRVHEDGVLSQRTRHNGPLWSSARLESFSIISRDYNGCSGWKARCADGSSPARFQLIHHYFLRLVQAGLSRLLAPFMSRRPYFTLVPPALAVKGDPQLRAGAGRALRASLP